MADISGLQTAASRYAIIAGFGNVTPTGIADQATHDSVIKALSWIRDQVPSESQTASSLISQLTDLQSIQDHADGLTTYLNQVADNSGIGGSNFDFAPTVAKVETLWQAVPLWVKIGGGLALGLGLFIAGHRVAKRAGHQLHGWTAG